MSEDEACRRIQVARLAHRFSDLLVRIERGDLTLSTIALLQHVLTEASYEELVGAASGKTKGEVQALLAKRAPRPDVHRGMDLLIETLEKRRLGKTSRSQWLGEISRERRLDEGSREQVARGRGGTSEPENLRVRCRAHNRLYAEQTFGKENVERKIRERRDPRERGSAPERDAPESCALAASGLVNLGFRRADVRRAIDTVSARHPAEILTTLSVQTILREALAVLT